MAKEIVIREVLESKIFSVRGHKVMFDHDLAALYGVGTKALNQAVKRNMERFPEDFMFRLSTVEVENLRSQFVTSSRYGGRRYLPFAFTETGVAMLSGVLNSRRAIDVNVQIIRTFVRLRKVLESHADLARKLEELERKYDSQFKEVFDAIRALMRERRAGVKKIDGFKP